MTKIQTVFLGVLCFIAPLRMTNEANSDPLKPSEKTRFIWAKKAALVHQGMSWPQVKKILPPMTGSGLFVSSDGGAYAVIYPLEKYWMATVFFAHSNRKVLGKPHLKRCDPPNINFPLRRTKHLKS